MILPDSRFEMPELFTPGQKPVGNVVIDWSHPLARDLKICVLFGSDTRHPDLCGVSWTLESGTPQYGTVSGDSTGSLSACYGNIGISNSLNYKAVGMKNTAGNIGRTVLFDVKPSLLQDGDGYVLSLGSSGTGTGMQFRTGAAGQLGKARVEVGSGFRVFDTGDLSAIRHRGAFVFPKTGTNVTDFSFYLNGIEQSVFSQGSRALSTTANNPVLFSNTAQALFFGGSTYNAEAVFVMYWERELSEEEIVSTTADPYQFLIPA